MEVQLHAFFDLGTRWRWVVSWYPLDKRLGGPQIFPNSEEPVASFPCSQKPTVGIYPE